MILSAICAAYVVAHVVASPEPKPRKVKEVFAVREPALPKTLPQVLQITERMSVAVPDAGEYHWSSPAIAPRAAEPLPVRR
jgi:hypothetical protein